MRSRLPFVALLAAFSLLEGVPASAQKFYPDDPIRVDHDDLPIDKPGIIELSPTYDLLENTFQRPELPPEVPRAANVNTLGEVPDSSWFENRIGIRDMTLEELARGPNEGPPPQLPLVVTAAKASGITAGFTVRDATGRAFFLKLDPKEHPSLSTGADVIGKSFFYAIGYNVPAAYIVYFQEEDLRIEEGAELRLPGGELAPLDEAYIRSVLDASARRTDGPDGPGRIRAIASLAVPGEVLGPFKFVGTRPDDPNDVIPHEDRRELRGYRLFCAWLNHDDSRAINTLDAYVGSPGAGHVRHYLIDFGSILGSGSDRLRRIAPQDPRSGNEYVVDFEPIWKAAYSFGVLDRAWRKVDYLYPRYAEVGRIEAEFFDPEAWRPEYPNPAFDRMLADDAFWAARIVGRFSDEAIRAIVATADYESKEAERFLADTIVQRRDKVVARYFRAIDPLVDFAVTDALEFRHLGLARGLGEIEGYEHEWYVLDNDTGQTSPISGGGVVREAKIPLPESDAPYLMVRIRSLSSEAGWRKYVDVYLRGREVVGIEREIP
jgi:hypothetical protein